MTPRLFLLCLTLAPLGLQAQKSNSTRLFRDETPLKLSLRYSMKLVSKTRNDTVYSLSSLSYTGDNGSFDSMTVGVRARGNFRRKNCFFAPLKLKIKKSEAKETIFKGNKSLKLVLPCRHGDASNDLIMKEYVCYKLYEVLTKYAFRTRLANMKLTDTGGKHKSYDVLSFFIEDDYLAAKRWNGVIVDSTSLNPFMLQDTSSLIHGFFQCMIANTDFSAMLFHNTKIVRINATYIPVAYDFDMCGLVNAQYAVANPALNITSVRERLYRGFCRNESLTEYVRQHFIGREDALMQVLDSYQWYFKPQDIEAMKKYVGEFFTVLKSDKKFKERIATQCRTK